MSLERSNWAQMLYRMYTMYIEKKGFTYKILVKGGEAAVAFQLPLPRPRPLEDFLGGLGVVPKARLGGALVQLLAFHLQAVDVQRLEGFTYKILDYLDGDEAGIKSASILVEGLNAYGYLKADAPPGRPPQCRWAGG